MICQCSHYPYYILTPRVISDQIPIKLIMYKASIEEKNLLSNIVI